MTYLITEPCIDLKDKRAISQEQLPPPDDS
jgi:hypothetical protein